MEISRLKLPTAKKSFAVAQCRILHIGLRAAILYGMIQGLLCVANLPLQYMGGNVCIMVRAANGRPPGTLRYEGLPPARITAV